jgi:zinc/manganese transport system permease protein
MEILQFLILPFIASLILTGIHAYLGVHVVERGVIFVDLALAQIAALGATTAILIGMDPHGTGAYWMSLGFTFVGAAIFTFVRSRHKRIPLEAFIGITYAVASAAAIIAMSKATGETEHLKDMLVGNILAVSRHDVIKTALLYGAIGLFHFIFRRKFLAISLGHNTPDQTARLNVRLWDFLFYASFGFVVTSSFVIWWCPRSGPCCLLTASVPASPSAGPWERWCRRWAATFPCSLIRRRAQPSCAPSAPCWW